MGQTSPVTLEEGRYRGWKALTVRNGPLALVLVPQVGGRIMSMQWRGYDLSFTQPERRGQVEEVSRAPDVRDRKRKMGRVLWGGDKTWLAPQTRWTDGYPFLDLDSGGYELKVEQSGPERVVVRLVSPICRETGVQITRTLAVCAGATDMTVTHELFNTSSAEITWGVWDVTMVLRPGKVYLPRRRNSSYPGGIKTYPEEGESVQARGKVVSELGSLAVVTCDHPRKFKFGVDAETTLEGQCSNPGTPSQDGWMLGVLNIGGHGLVGYCKQIPVYRGQLYGHGCVAEVYNSDEYEYFEMEVHGPQVTLQPAGRFALTERQALFDVAAWPAHEGQVRQLVTDHLNRPAPY